MSKLTSETLTKNESLPTLPAASVAVHVTVLFPNAKIVPDTGKQLGPFTTPTLSVAVPLENEIIFPCEFDVDSKIFSGGVTTGAIVSTML